MNRNPDGSGSDNNWNFLPSELREKFMKSLDEPDAETDTGAARHDPETFIKPILPACLDAKVKEQILGLLAALDIETNGWGNSCPDSPVMLKELVSAMHKLDLDNTNASATTVVQALRQNSEQPLSASALSEPEIKALCVHFSLNEQAVLNQQTELLRRFNKDLPKDLPDDTPRPSLQHFENELYWTDDRGDRSADHSLGKLFTEALAILHLPVGDFSVGMIQQALANLPRGLHLTEHHLRALQYYTGIGMSEAARAKPPSDDPWEQVSLEQAELMKRDRRPTTLH